MVTRAAVESRLTPRASTLPTAEMLRLFDLLKDELARTHTYAERFLVGGAVMCHALGARAARRDINAWFQPSAKVRTPKPRAPAYRTAGRAVAKDCVTLLQYVNRRLPEEYRSMTSDFSVPDRAAPVTATGNLASISPFFIVKDLNAAISHYVDRFGFQLDFQGPPDDPYYGQVSRDGIGIMLKAINPDVLPIPNHVRHEWARWDAYIYTRDPDPLFAEFKQRGASFVKELSFIDDGLWGFEVTDADGYVLAFFLGACAQEQRRKPHL